MASAALALLLSSCVGVDATATIKADGSGRLALKYLVSPLFASFGSLEANERLIPFPVSREDFERSVRGLQGIELLSYSQKRSGEDLLVEVELSFSSLPALASFLDPKAERAIYSDEGGRRNMKLILAAGGPPLDPDVAKLVDTAFAPYSLSMELRLPSRALSAGIGAVSGNGAIVSYKSPVASLAKSEKPVVWEIAW
jgi:hypothetical protein